MAGSTGTSTFCAPFFGVFELHDIKIDFVDLVIFFDLFLARFSGPQL